MPRIENLFPEDELELTEEDVQEDDQPVGYMASVYFDEALGDLPRDGQHRIKSATGQEAWEQWCINCIMTERDVYPAYGSLFGISTVEAFKSDDTAEIESILTLEIIEGLMNDPYGRTAAVRDIEYNWLENNEAVEVLITVEGIEEVTIDLSVVIDKRAR